MIDCERRGIALAARPASVYTPRMHGFAYRNGSLHCEDVDLQTLAIINQAQPSTRFDAGTEVKRVVGGA